MGRILGIDFGLKRIGIAVTDPLKIAVHGLETVPYDDIEKFLDDYLASEDVETIVVGDPFTEGIFNKHLYHELEMFIKWLKDKFPGVAIERQDEGFSSDLARKTILQSGAKQKKRQDKALVDRISAVLILQQFLGHI
jgi:putative Holliday junction resolvase